MHVERCTSSVDVKGRQPANNKIQMFIWQFWQKVTFKNRIWNEEEFQKKKTKLEI